MHEHPTGQSPAPQRSYGRRKGKKLSARKERLIAELLPALRPPLGQPAPEDPCELLPVAVRELWLEIGFGAGEHLLWQAERNPDVGLMGCETFINGVSSLLGAIEDRGLRNVLVHDGDARDVLAWLPTRSIARVFVLFPDPWPKRRQSKRRLISPAFVQSVARVLPPGGEFRFASDDMDYAGETLFAVNANGAFVWQAETATDWRERCDDWPETRYERKALSGGRRPAYFRWLRSPGLNPMKNAVY